MEEKKITFSEIIEKMKSRHEEYMAKNPEILEKIKNKQNKQVSFSTDSLKNFIEKIREAKAVKDNEQ